MGSPGPAKSRHNKREQRGPDEKLAGGDRDEGTRSGQAAAQAAGGAAAGPAAPRGTRSPAIAPPAGRATSPGLPAGSRRRPGRLVAPATALCFRAATRVPSSGSPDNTLVPTPGGSPSRPLPVSLSNFLGRGRWDGGVGSVCLAGLCEVNSNR